MKTRYALEYDWQAKMVVEVDDEILTPALLHDWNTFWGGADERIESGEGNPLQPLLKMMYLRVISCGHDQLDALQRLRTGREEGFLKMDGSQGITIVSFEEFEFDDHEVECRRVEA